jgi:hypothetical protein
MCQAQYEESQDFTMQPQGLAPFQIAFPWLYGLEVNPDLRK